jgi:hypothetical protein
VGTQGDIFWRSFSDSSSNWIHKGRLLDVNFQFHSNSCSNSFVKFVPNTYYMSNLGTHGDTFWKSFSSIGSIILAPSGKHIVGPTLVPTALVLFELLFQQYSSSLFANTCSRSMCDQGYNHGFDEYTEQTNAFGPNFEILSFILELNPSMFKRCSKQCSDEQNKQTIEFRTTVATQGGTFWKSFSFFLELDPLYVVSQR